MCIFSNISPETVVGLINAACGYQWTITEMLIAGERGWNLKRAINHRLGLTGANDRLPKPLLQPYTDCLPRQECFAVEFEEMLAAYYAARGWDPATGYPTQEKLEALGLDFVKKDLYP